MVSLVLVSRLSSVFFVLSVSFSWSPLLVSRSAILSWKGLSFGLYCSVTSFVPHSNIVHFLCKKAFIIWFVLLS